MEVVVSPEKPADDDENEDNFTIEEPKIENYAIEELERTLAHLIETENYEEAAKVSEILNKKKRESGQ